MLGYQNENKVENLTHKWVAFPAQITQGTNILIYSFLDDIWQQLSSHVFKHNFLGKSFSVIHGKSFAVLR